MQVPIWAKLNSTAYPDLVEEISDALRRVEASESTILLRDFNAHGNKIGVWMRESG